ncbi:multidrug effflux MFS transporter [Nonomuraea diastatica]|uniref:Bcr/CflA family efflux MFS transporter n=1 Tax=Nonomuraea diastatica TaxID=1848329 RepID=A0A4R4WE85_9ACTN|nr:multidrug effflux MFS transporter [Nonomuraea diastatica]TDD17249.1 Bcr/CflA family efflux MFS transporter [Nonomuraea diastatica]
MSSNTTEAATAPISGRPPEAALGQAPPKQVARLILMLAALTALAPLANGMYIPGFPELARSLGATDSSVQLSMTAFLVGLAAGQILLGPISDALGRRSVLLAGAGLFTIFSVICAVAPTIEVFNAARLLEGITGAAGLVIARAVLTDRFHGTPAAARHFSTLSAIVVVAPVAAPILGGAVLGIATWRTVFAVLAAFGLVLAVVVALWLPESLPADRRRGGGVGRTFKAMAGLLSGRAVVGYVLTSSFTSAALFIYISGSAFVFHQVYGVSSGLFSLIFAVNAFGSLAGGILFGRLAARVRFNTLLIAGLALSLVAAAVLVLLLASTGGNLATVWICLFFALTGIGVVFPATMTIIQSLGHRAPGAASGLIGGSQFVFGAAASPLAGLLGTSTAVPMAVLMLAAFTVSTLALVTIARPWRGHGEPTRTKS